MREMKSLGRRPTAADVAKVAGVSQATVSYVLNDSPNQTIPEETRQRVVQAAAELRYTPHSAARTLRRGKSDNVLLLTPNWPTGSATAELLDLMANEFRKHGLTLVTKRLWDNMSVASAWQSMAPAAVVASAAITDAEIKAIRDAGVFVAPILLRDDGSDAIVVSQENIGLLQAHHLIECGHRHIAYAGHVDERIATFRDLRFQGVVAACEAAGVAAPAMLRFPLELTAAVNAIRTWRDRPDPVTAICAYNDEYAFALLAAARQLKLTVPVDLAIVGVADLVTAQFADPPLTTVQINQQRLAEQIVEFVKRGINGNAREGKVCLNTFKLIVRQSA